MKYANVVNFVSLEILVLLVSVVWFRSQLKVSLSTVVSEFSLSMSDPASCCRGWSEFSKLEMSTSRDKYYDDWDVARQDIRIPLGCCPS